MSKREELNIKFCKEADVAGEPAFIMDSSNGVGNHKRLHFIDTLPRTTVLNLAETIDLIQNGKTYDPDFLTDSEELDVFSIEFANPYFKVDGYQTIHMNDLKLLLQEWLHFINS